MSDEALPELPTFKPAVGDLIMRGHAEGDTATCGVVIDVFKNDVGEAFYLIQTTMNMIQLKGLERLTQHELDLLGYHPATKEEWAEDWQDKQTFYQAELKKLYEKIEPYVSSDGKAGQ